MQTSTLRKLKLQFPNAKNFMEQVDEVILQNLSNEKFCMADLVAHLSLSSSQIYRKIKQKTGLSPNAYVRTFRLRYARELIIYSDLSFSEIAFQVGFNGLSYFSKCFSRHFGSTPSQYRMVTALY